MIKKEYAEQRTAELLEPLMEKNGFELVDVEYVKEGADRILRVYIDKTGGIRIDDCELISRALSDELDKDDKFDEAYVLEVSSPGLLRPFRKDKDFARNIGETVELHLFKAQDKEKDFIGVLKSFTRDSVVLELEEGKETVFLRSSISLIRKYIDFSDL